MLEYNTGREKLVIREYGRNIQKMIEEAVKIEDRGKRNEAARAIVKAMSFVNPMSPTGSQANPTNNNAQPDAQRQKQRESLDFWRKLWDHLIIISDYKLDVDSPFEKPVPADQQEKPDIRVSYKQGHIRTRTYGRYIDSMIKTVAAYPDGEEKTRITMQIANQMKRLYLAWNRDSVSDELIISQLEQLSEGKLTLPPDFVFAPVDDLPVTSSIPSKPKKKKRKKKRKSSSAAETQTI
ncbi:MAG: DUF4290 domain-containing protein [Bacteroidales bacterium]|nr:DUF4290 domain-containing protein [Bacteroidales bacterium]